MDTLKLLGGLALAVLVVWALLTVVTLAGVGVDTQLPGSDWQAPALVTAAALLGALAGVAALGSPWRDTGTTYW